MSFVIAYVPEVEYVGFVDTVDKVNKLPEQHFSFKKHNSQPGGLLQVSNLHGMYQGQITPQVDFDFKGMQVVCDAYNVEDTYSVLVGDRVVISNSHVKEMGEVRNMLVNEIVPAGTSISILYTNNSGTSKNVMFDFFLQVDDPPLFSSNFVWSFVGLGTDAIIVEGGSLVLNITQPAFVGPQTQLSTGFIRVLDLTGANELALIGIDSLGNISTNYVETEPAYTGMGLLARSNIVGITSITRLPHSLEIIFNNLGGLSPTPIEMKLEATITNIVI